MHFNYRIVRRKYKEDAYVEIHTVYYNKNGEICGISETPADPIGSHVDELKADYDRVLMAFNKPVLDMDGFKYAPWDFETEEDFPTDLGIDNSLPSESSESSETPESSGSSMHMRWLLQQTDM